jgi:hypothetical protein
LGVLVPGLVPPEVDGFTLWEVVCEVRDVDVDVEVPAGAVVVAVDAEVEVLEDVVDGATLEVVVSEETPADCVVVELPPQPASRAVAAITARAQMIRFVGIDRSAYPKDQFSAASAAGRF